MKLIPKHIRFFVCIFLAGLVAFTSFRLLLFFSNFSLVNTVHDQKIWIFLQAFLMGIRFDIVISGYLLIIPFFIISILDIFSLAKNRVYKYFIYIILVLYSLSFFICSADIPYFKQFMNRFSSAAFLWMDDPAFMAGMILKEIRYWIYLVPFLISVVLLRLILLRLHKKIIINNQTSTSNIIKITGSLIILGLLILGMRGRIEQKSPIQVGTAYFSDYEFPNQLGLNPVFTLINSVLADLDPENQRPHFMQDELAINYVRQQFKTGSGKYAYSPIARVEQYPITTIKPNVIIVIMESMSAAKLGLFGNKDHLTPTLDSLAKVSYSFSNIFSSSMHTFGGIYSTLFSYPVIFTQHPLRHIPMLKYTGIAATLKEKGYNTIYFTTHDDQFDNIGGFLRANGFSKIISQKDYPSGKVKSVLGVPDHVMFDHAVSCLNELGNTKKPFLGVLLTASDHGPYQIPDDIGFVPKNSDIQKGIVEYADWSIGRFINKCSNQPWFNNTIFVFVADHGCLNYSLPLAYNHTPLIIYSPAILNNPRTFNCLGSQTDIFPTIMGLLQMSYNNNTFGIDLLKDKRSFVYFCDDEKLECINNDYCLVIENNKLNTLYKYNEKDPHNLLALRKDLADSMKTYAGAMLQTAQWLIDNNKTGK